MNLYLKNQTKNLVRSETFPITSQVIGKYIANIFYVPDDEFEQCMNELGQASTILDPADNQKLINNQVITLYSDSNKIDAFLRPDSLREKDREDARMIKELKARGIVIDMLKKQ